MKITLKIALLLLATLMAFSMQLDAQEKYTINGHIRDADSGEALIGATVYVTELGSGAVSNLYGFYSITLPAGDYQINYSYVGFESQARAVKLGQDEQIDIELGLKGTLIEEIVVKAESEKKNVEAVEMSSTKMNVETISKIPALMGEVDIIKAIQLLPGVQTAGEGTSGFYVRGGAVDQNLILLDEAPVYNAAHLMGFFSVFNPDAVKDVKLYKGGIPAEYGGRLSSVLDIRMKEGNNKRFAGSAGIGTISSRLTLEAPIVKDKGSFLISGRRTYADIFTVFAKDTSVRDNKLYFYDLNLKANYKLSEKDRIYASGYFGRDVLGDSEFKISWGNATSSIRWNHVYNKRLFSNFTAIYSNFDYSLGEPEGVGAFEWNSNIRDWTGKLDFNYYLNTQNTLRFGLISTAHKFNPGVALGLGDETIFNEIGAKPTHALEHAAYVSNEMKITPLLTAQYGVRVSVFQNIGPGTVYSFDNQYEPTDTTVYEKGDIYNTYSSIEPRLGIRYTLSPNSSIKASYNRTTQYMQMASNSTSASPLDVWFPASPNVKPQRADQVALGYFTNLRDNEIEASVEVYYKKMYDQVDFKDHAQLLLNPQLEGELRTGKARAYGLELLVKKQKGRLTGWIGYTLSRTERNITAINNGNWYPAKYDKTHDISVVGSYDLNDRWDFAATWIYGTGSAVTMPTGRFEYAGVIAPVYSDRNDRRLPAYHRFDISATLYPKKVRKITGNWVFSVYNAYNKKNAFSILFEPDENDPNVIKSYKTYLFPIIPSVTKNFKF